MKKFFLSSLMFLLLAAGAWAQCDKPVKYYSEKQELLNENGDVVANEQDVMNIEFTKEKITVKIEGKAGELTGNIKDVDCQWKELYKEGKAVYKVEFIDPEKGESKDGTVTVQAKEGSLFLLVTFAGMEGKTGKVIVSKYEEK